MLLKILIDHEFSDPAMFAMFATGYAELCRSLGVTAKSGNVAPATIQPAASRVIPIADEPATVQTPAPLDNALPVSPQSDTAPKRRGRPPSSETAARKPVDAPSLPLPESEPAKDVAPTAPAPAESPMDEAPAAPSAPVAVDIGTVKAALNKLIMSVDGGEEAAGKIKTALFPGKKLADLDADTLATVYAALVAAMEA